MSQRPLARGGAIHHRLPTLLSQQQHRGPPLPYLEQHSESSVGFSHLGRETGDGIGTMIQCLRFESKTRDMYLSQGFIHTGEAEEAEEANGLVGLSSERQRG